MAKSAGIETELALRATLNEKQLKLPLRELRRVRLSELPGVSGKKAAALEAVGIRNLADFGQDPDLARVAFLLDFVGRGRDRN